MNAVIEINVIGKIMHTPPIKWLPSAPAFADRLQRGWFFPYNIVTFHTSRCGGDTGKRRFFCGSMAKTAINTKVFNVVLMAEWHRLLNCNPNFSVKRWTHKPKGKKAKADHRKEAQKNGQPRHRVGGRRKYLFHWILKKMLWFLSRGCNYAKIACGRLKDPASCYLKNNERIIFAVTNCQESVHCTQFPFFYEYKIFFFWVSSQIKSE